VLSADGFPAFACPRCRAELRTVAGDHECTGCNAHYPVVLGIPDFRVDADPWIGLEEDREKARRLVRETEGLGFEASVAAYWRMTPATPAPLAQRFTEHVVAGERRAGEWLDTVAPAGTAAATGATQAGAWLEIGCGTGDLLAVAAARGIPMVGIDVALRWLVIARKRRALAGGAQLLVCGNGEHLPFRDASFARVISIGTLEHCRDAGAVLAESARTLRAGGFAHVRTVNRFTLLPEPHVGVWGVGFVPRPWADAYVRWRSGQRYLHHHPLSKRELGRALRRAGFADVTVAPSALLPSELARAGRMLRRVAPSYDRARRAPALGNALAWVSPLMDAGGRAR
jgi:SAM-dependent methyltransferase